MIRTEGQPIDAVVGQRLREQRERAGLTIAAVALALGREDAEMSAIEAGSVRAEPRLLVRIAALLNIPLTALFDGEIHQPSTPTR